MGKLIVIEGVDASGKATQTEKLYNYLKEKYEKVVKIEFPDYDSPSSTLVKMYLNGEFGKNADDVSPYAASVFFAADRFASYKTKWQKLYEDGYIVIADRYVTANMLHQASKIDNKEKKSEFLNWLSDFEYEKLSLPKPDIKIFLDMPCELSFKLMEKRLNKFTNEEKKDIHESNREYMKKTYENAKYIAENFGFNIIECSENGDIKSIDDIHSNIKEVIECNLKI